MKPAIVAIGTANPIYKQHQKNAAELISILLNLSPVEKRLLKSVYRSTGIEYRYSVLNDFCKMPGQFEFFPNEPNVPFPTTATRMQIYKKNALKLALAAVEDCLSNVENFDKHQITHLIAISCTGMYAPGIDIEIVQELHLNPSVKRTSINFMGCYAAFNGLEAKSRISFSQKGKI